MWPHQRYMFLKEEKSTDIWVSLHLRFDLFFSRFRNSLSGWAEAAIFFMSAVEQVIITGESHRIGNNATTDSKSPISNRSSAVPGNSTHYFGQLALSFCNISTFFLLSSDYYHVTTLYFKHQSSLTQSKTTARWIISLLPLFPSFSPFPRLKSDYSLPLIELHQLLSMRPKKNL